MASLRFLPGKRRLHPQSQHHSHAISALSAMLCFWLLRLCDVGARLGSFAGLVGNPGGMDLVEDWKPANRKFLNHKPLAILLVCAPAGLEEGCFLFISLKDLELRDVRFQVDIPAGQIDFDSKLTQTSDLHAEGEASMLKHSLGEIRLRGHLRIETSAVCDRCLEAIQLPLQNQFDLVYMPAADTLNGGEDEIDEAAVEVGFYQGNGLELDDVLREVVLLALPMQLVCREACKGICPVCGQNRNQRECQCQTKAADDRWNSLKSLRADMAREGIRK